MKSILIFFPRLCVKVSEGAKHRLNTFIDEYHEAGYEVTVLAFYKDLFLRNKRRYLNPNAKWILLPYVLPSTKSRILAKALDLYYKLSLAFVSRRKKYDLVQMELIAVRHKWCSPDSFYVTDIHGDTYHEYVEVYPNHKPWLAKLYLKQQAEIVSESDFCICVSENLKTQIEKNAGRRISRFGIVSCGVDAGRFMVAVPPADLAERLKGRIVVGYSGGLQEWQNAELIIRTAIRLHRIDSRFFLAFFTNHDLSPYQGLLDELGSGNYLAKALTPEQIPSYLKLLDAGFLLRDNWILNVVSSPTKTCEYLAAGVPVVCTQWSGDYSQSVFHKETGFILQEPQADGTEIQELARWICDVKQNREAYASRCRAEAEKRLFTTEFNQTVRKMTEVMPK